METEPDKWFWDRINKNLVQLHNLEDIVHTRRTKYQFLEIIRTGGFGKCLVLDGKIQSSELDEFIYHEALVQPAMLAHPKPEKVLIAGGGEGATLREALSHPSVKRAVMIDIDEDVIDACREYLPDFSRGAFEDKRTELQHVDARKYLKESRAKFDVIIIDLPDPIEEGPAYLLFTQEFYRLVRDRLTTNGVISVQAGSAILGELVNFSAVYNTLKSVFTIVSPYQVEMPAFGGSWGFCLASMDVDVTKFTPDEVNKRLAARSLGDLRFYDGITHQGMFYLPRYLRAELAKQTRLITDAQPLYLYQGKIGR